MITIEGIKVFNGTIYEAAVEKDAEIEGLRTEDGKVRVFSELDPATIRNLQEWGKQHPHTILQFLAEG